jgi:ATP-dependent DNA helicase RecQ
MLRKEIKPAKAARKNSREAYSSTSYSGNALWEALRACRKQLADAFNVPPYVIFHDSTLKEMLEQQPTTHAQFLQLTGVGQAKLERYADAFIKVICEVK